MATLDFTAIGRDRGASRMLQNLGKESDKTHSKMSHLNSGMGKLGKVGAAGGAAAAAGLALGAGAALKFGLDTAMANERAKIGFTTMLGSAKKADVFLRQLQQFAATTPFEFPELQKAASGLVAVGVQTKEIIPIMKTVGNVTSGMGTGSEGVQRAVLALQQMSAAGRISAEDLNQLRDAGLSTNIVFDAISQKTGISTKKLYEMRDAGKLGKRELDALMESLASGKGFEKFNGLMDKQSQSLEGMLSTLKDTFGQGMAEALQSAMPFIKGAIGAVTESVGNFFDWVNTHQEDFVIGIVNTGDAVLKLAKTFLVLNSAGLKALGSIADGIATVLEGMDKLALGDQFSGTVSALRDFSAGATAAGDAINNDLIPQIDSAHAEWTAFGKDQRTKAALRDANQVIQNAVKTTTESLKTNGKTIDNNTEKGKNNRAALRNLAASQVDYRNKLSNTGAKTKDVDRYTEQARKTFIATAIKLGATEKEAKALADRYGLLDRRINALNSKTIRLTTNYRATAAESFAKFIENVPAGPNRSGFSQLPRGGPAKARSLDSMIGAPASPPVGFAQGGPSLTSIRHSSPGLSNALGDPAKFRDAAFTAGRYISRKSSAWLGDKSQDYVNGLMTAPGAPSGSVGTYSAGMAATISRLRAAGARSFTTYPGHHPSAAKARDVTPHNWRIANTARASSGVWYVIYQMRIASKNHGNTWRQYNPTNHNGDWQHRRHVHVAWYDKGGLLRPGWTMAYNGTGRSERVTPAGGGGNTYIINAPNYIGDKQDLVKALTDLDRQGRLAVVRR